MKTRKLLDINHNGVHLVCIHRDKPGEANPFRLYQISYDGFSFHRKQIVKYGDFQSVLWCIAHNHAWFEGR